jgi:hypothetical protein
VRRIKKDVLRNLRPIVIQVIVSNKSQQEKSPTNIVDDDEEERSKKRNPFAKKKIVASSQPISPTFISSTPHSSTKSSTPFSSSKSPTPLSSFDSGMFAQPPVEINSSQLSVCSIDSDQVSLGYHRLG